jgi:hypothetical protein
MLLNNMEPKHIRARLHIQEACELEPEFRYKELLDIIIDYFGVRHIESMEEKVMKILETREKPLW